MRTIILSALLISACGPESSQLVDCYTYRGITLTSEVMFDTSVPSVQAGAPSAMVSLSSKPKTTPRVPVLYTRKIKDDIDLILATFERLGISTAEQTPIRLTGVEIVVRSTPFIKGGSHAKAYGTFKARIAERWIELSNHGGALGHEMLHAMGYSHDAAEVWTGPMADVLNAADAEFNHWNGGWANER